MTRVDPAHRGPIGNRAAARFDRQRERAGNRAGLAPDRQSDGITLGDTAACPTHRAGETRTTTTGLFTHAERAEAVMPSW